MNPRGIAAAAVLSFAVFCISACGSSGPTSSESGGVPSRHALEHPLAYDYKLIQSWAKEHRPRTYAGAFYRHSGPGMLVIGFIQDQNRDVEIIRHLPGLVEPSRITIFSRSPDHTLASLEELDRKFTHEFEVNETLNDLVTGWQTNVQRNAISVGSEEPRKLKQELINLYGADAPFVVRWDERGHET